MKVVMVSAAILVSFGFGYLFALKSSAKPEIRLESINSKVIPRSQTQRESGNWGVMDKYTHDHMSTYGTENMFTALVDLLPGETVHPPHRHAEEEFLLITEGTGVWSLEGKEIEAKSGDLLYAQPWKMHGLVNTGTDTMTFFFLKWLNKGVPSPVEPEGDHG
ncbi:cupin domain-containing protein [Candidatus Neomarinimicrobiota bacterium]